MKKLQIYGILLSLCIAPLFQANSSDSKDQTASIKHASLQSRCAIKIIKEKLLHANNSSPIESRAEEVVSIFKNLYDECNTTLNSSNTDLKQHNTTEADWVNKMLKEIYILQHNNEMKDCYNQAMNLHTQTFQSLKSSDKYSAMRLIFKNIQNCSESKNK